MVAPGSRVLVAGAGNGDDLPLGRLARRASRVDLLDLDAAALTRARRGVRRGRRRVHALVEDLTDGRADALVAAAPGPPAPGAAQVPAGPLGAAPYDVVIADLVLTQLLYPALRRRGLGGGEIDGVLLRDGQALTDAVVARLHASAPGGVVVVLHDLLGWWDGHPQPFALQDVLALARHDPGAALRRARGGSPPYGCDPWLATRRAGAHVQAMRLWRWPFAPGADYLVCGLVTRRGPAPR
ncbi:hypothetical protein FSW04_23935 [Baekduia soli]|uniref:Class I SAM-dependent methyltransferase n=1 Tax=Baekduia soli TaxID=496014 RepID=A0A5B8UCE4_9ACTN|nr:hypothetical protein [Baekduia soli]QEC50331.1 hypothetical protein FSW04_23935 [Baekduia soli]